MSIRRRHVVERLMQALMLCSLGLVLASVAAIIGVIVVRGAPALSWRMLVQPPQSGYYAGRGSGSGIANALVGSVYVAFGGTLLASLVSLPVACALQKQYLPGGVRRAITLMLDVLWGVPSVVTGAFCFIVMAHYGLRASLAGGICTIALVIMPVMVRAMAEAMSAAPAAMHEAACALGATRFGVTVRIVLRQTVPGLVTAVLLAFGRGIGDAASLLFTSGYSDFIPRSLSEPAASLPLAIFFQLNSPFPEVQRGAYAAALVLLLIVVVVTAGARACAARLGIHVVR